MDLQDILNRLRELEDIDEVQAIVNDIDSANMTIEEQNIEVRENIYEIEDEIVDVIIERSVNNESFINNFVENETFINLVVERMLQTEQIQRITQPIEEQVEEAIERLPEVKRNTKTIVRRKSQEQDVEVDLDIKALRQQRISELQPKTILGDI